MPYSYAQSNASYQMLLSRSNFAKKPHVEMLNILHSSQLFLLTKDFFACQRLLYMNKFRTFAVGCITLRTRVRQKMHSVVSLKNCMAMYLDFEKTFGLLVAVFSFAAFAYIK